MVCSMIDVINEKYIPKAEKYMKDRMTISIKEMVYGFLASYNEYYPLSEHNFFRLLECSGMAVYQP